MALYKRYVPPTASTKTGGGGERSGAAQNFTTIERHGNQLPTQAESPATRNKVKKSNQQPNRSRPHEAKDASWASAGVIASPETQHSIEPITDLDGLAELPQPKGAFAHIKNAQKRHKLEKEARKARKLLEKSDIGYVASQSEENHGLANGGTRAASRLHSDIVPAKLSTTGGAHDATDAHPTQDEQNKKRKRSAKDELSTVIRPEPTATGSQGVYHDSQTVPRKRRHKLEKLLEEGPGIDASNIASNAVNDHRSDEIEDHLRKHSGIVGKFQKALQAPQIVSATTAEDSDTKIEPVLRDLAPLPQPAQRDTPDADPEYSALPAWLAQATLVSSDQRRQFKSMGLGSELTARLSRMGFEDALPVQQSVIPLLMEPGSAGSAFNPGTHSALPDLAVSAATGSGKTLAYLIPMIEALRQGRSYGHVRALVVVPTRELVDQVVKTAEALAEGSGVSIGSATGSSKLRDEQSKLMTTRYCYDPTRYAGLIAQARLRHFPPDDEEDDQFEDYLDLVEREDVKLERRIHDALTGQIDHIPVYECKVDLLVCTPGRLLEHMAATCGFSLKFLEWMVLDEVDKLLGEQYDGFLERVSQEISEERIVEEQTARERVLRSWRMWDERQERRVRKILLSATMTRDISKLLVLKLRNPKLLIVRGEDTASGLDNESNTQVASAFRDAGEGFELPTSLAEFCVPVGDGTEKPLYLVELLASRILPTNAEDHRTEDEPMTGVTNSSALESRDDSDSDDDSISSSDVSSESSVVSSASDSASEPETTSSIDDAADESEHGQSSEPAAMHPSRAALLDDASQTLTTPTVLVFTSSNEAAQRLSHLLKKLRPQWSSWISTMTKTPTKRPSRSQPSLPSITISTDRAARGLDVLYGRAITHVVQYDVPRSLSSYVHRAGRTARAGRNGDAWTLYTHSEARWFLHEVTKAPGLWRAQAVDKVKLDVHDDALRERYQQALSDMRDEVFGDRPSK